VKSKIEVFYFGKLNASPFNFKDLNQSLLRCEEKTILVNQVGNNDQI
jgi:hypothetical protein